MDKEPFLLDDVAIDVNDDFARAFELLEQTAQSVFLTGKAGTGKSTFLQYFRKQTKKNVVVLAPTGVAAVNVKGQTIHSFFSFKPDITPDSVAGVRMSMHQAKLYRRLDALVIDEISMVRADLLDCVDAFLRLYGPQPDVPFGGVQMIFIGDLYQLPPVVRQNEKNLFQTVYSSPYFFAAKVFKTIALEIVEFEINYRQKEDHFLEVLNRIRTNTVEQQHVDQVNERCLADFQPDDDDFCVYLTTTNKLADEINYERIHNLKQELFCLEGTVSGDFQQKELPTHQTLELKAGAQVILLNNDAQGRWVNGSIGKVIDIFDVEANSKAILVELPQGQRVEVEPFTWELFQFFYNEATDSIESDVVGSFRQFPIKLAWAVTIHKSQGKTFEKVIIDIGHGTFCHGQMYVALSRCRTLGGIILKRPISRRDIVTDPRIAQFMTQFQYQSAERKYSTEDKKKILENAIAAERHLEILYLKENNEKHRRKIIPRTLRPIEHQGQKSLGLEAFCLERQAHWVFRLNCILEIREVGEG